MESLTFRSRLQKLIQKSRRALRLYSSVERGEGTNEFTEAQALEWKRVNGDLLRQLSVAMEHPNLKLVVRDVCALKDFFHTEWRSAESEVHTKQRDLIFSSENGDFIRAALLSRELVSLKAKLQASHAAHHELEALAKMSKLSDAPIELTIQHVVPDLDDEQFERKVIPLRRKQIRL